MLNLTEESDIEEFGIYADLGKRKYHYCNLLIHELCHMHRYTATSHYS